MISTDSLCDIWEDMSEEASDFGKLTRYVRDSVSPRREQTLLILGKATSSDLFDPGLEWAVLSFVCAFLLVSTFLLAGLAAFDADVPQQIDDALH